MKDLTTYNDGIKDQYPKVATMLDELRQAARQTVIEGSQLGTYLTGAGKTNKADLMTWLGELVGEVRIEVIRFALKSYRATQRDPSLDDPSQLTFALCDGTQDQTASVQQHHAREHNEIADMTKAAMRIQSDLHDLVQAKPIAKWSPAMKEGVREVLRPLVEVWRELEA